LPPRDIELLFI
jgi:sugar lactone lactonase YvrE